jgi:hypothetical protein
MIRIPLSPSVCQTINTLFSPESPVVRTVLHPLSEANRARSSPADRQTRNWRPRTTLHASRGWIRPFRDPTRTAPGEPSTCNTVSDRRVAILSLRTGSSLSTISPKRCRGRRESSRGSRSRVPVIFLHGMPGGPCESLRSLPFTVRPRPPGFAQPRLEPLSCRRRHRDRRTCTRGYDRSRRGYQRGKGRSSDIREEQLPRAPCHG